jgi:hypothetical protein
MQPMSMICKYYNKESDINSTDKNYRFIAYQSKNGENKNEFLDDKLELAYAMTVHKAQGKGYDTVIILLHSSMNPKSLYINLLYTAITRAKKRVIIITDSLGLLECKKPMIPRITNLFRKKSVSMSCGLTYGVVMELMSAIAKRNSRADDLLVGLNLNPKKFDQIDKGYAVEMRKLLKIIYLKREIGLQLANLLKN